MIKNLVSLLIFLGSVQAYALWPHDGAVDIKDLRANPRNYIESDGVEQCAGISKDVTLLIQDLDDYQKFLTAGDSKNNKAALKILAKIKTEVSTPRVCQDYFYKVYLVKSLEILLDDNLIEFKNDYGLKLLDYEHQERRLPWKLQPGQIEMATSNDFLYFLSILIINRIPVEFLNDVKRTNLNGTQGNSLWTQKSSKTIGRYEVLGAFRCADHSIFLDPQLPPYDFAATWIHEMDHLYRDLLGPVDIWRENPLEAIRTDELLASVMTSFSQWNVRRAIVPRPPDLKARLANYFSPSETDHVVLDQFFINGDLSFLNRQGPLATLYSPRGVIKSIPVRYNIYHLLWAYFTSHDWLLSGTSFETVQKDWSYNFYNVQGKEYSSSDFVNRADSIVTKAYFGDAALQKYNSKSYGINYIPLSGWAADIMFPRYLESLTDNPILETLLKNLETGLKVKSPACQAFEDSEKRGALDSYLDASPGDAETNGKDGSRPGKDGSRPGKDGSRPGKDGSRPIQDIRPCLDLHDQL